MIKDVINPGQEFNKYDWLKLTMQMPLSDGAKMRAVSLYLFADAQGFCYPNQNHIESSLGHKHTGRTSAFVGELVASELVKVTKITVIGYKESNGYHLTFPSEYFATTVGAN